MQFVTLEQIELFTWNHSFIDDNAILIFFYLLAHISSKHCFLKLYGIGIFVGIYFLYSEKIRILFVFKNICTTSSLKIESPFAVPLLKEFAVKAELIVLMRDPSKYL